MSFGEINSTNGGDEVNLPTEKRADITQEIIEELRTEFLSKGGIVTVLPDVSEVREFTEVFIFVDNSGSKTYKIYKMIDNDWYLLLTATKV